MTEHDPADEDRVTRWSDDDVVRKESLLAFQRTFRPRVRCLVLDHPEFFDLDRATHDHGDEDLHDRWGDTERDNADYAYHHGFMTTWHPDYFRRDLGRSPFVGMLDPHR